MNYIQAVKRQFCDLMQETGVLRCPRWTKPRSQVRNIRVLQHCDASDAPSQTGLDQRLKPQKELNFSDFSDAFAITFATPQRRLPCPTLLRKAVLSV